MYTVLCGATGRNKFLWLMAFDFSRSIIKNYPGPGLLGPTVDSRQQKLQNILHNFNQNMNCIAWFVFL